MQLPPGLVGYRLVGCKGCNIVPIARDTGAIIIIIPVRGPPREVCVDNQLCQLVLGEKKTRHASIPLLFLSDVLFLDLDCRPGAGSDDCRAAARGLSDPTSANLQVRSCQQRCLLSSPQSQTQLRDWRA